MKKNNLILLTVLIMLVIYCGVVIFVTKPSDFAYEALFNDKDQAATAPAPEAPAVDRAELTAEMESIASRYADKAVDQAGRNADAAIREAIGNIDIDTGSGTVDVSAIVKSAVKDAVAEARDGIIREASALAAASILADKDDFVKEVSDKVTADVTENVTGKITADVTKKVTDSVSKTVTDKVTSDVTKNVTDKVTDSVTKDVTATLLSREDEVVDTVTEKVTARLLAYEDDVVSAVTRNVAAILLSNGDEPVSPEVIFNEDEIVRSVTDKVLSHEDEVVKAVTDNVLSREDEVVRAVTDSVLSHEDELVDRVTEAVLEKLKSNLIEALEEITEATRAAQENAGQTQEAAPESEDYDAIRNRMREEEIRKLLDQLQD